MRTARAERLRVCARFVDRESREIYLGTGMRGQRQRESDSEMMIE